MQKIIYVSAGEVAEEEKQLQQAMPGVTNVSLYHDEVTNVFIGQTRVEPNTTIPAHKGKGTGVFQVVSGSGRISVENDNGDEVNAFTVTAGDIFVYQMPQYNHKYLAGEDGLVYTAVAFPDVITSQKD